MIQKKICMVGVFATGKTSLVRQFVFSKFSERYHSTVGVKIDRKRVTVGDREVNMLLWDLEGRDGAQELQTSYLRGASGIIYVCDGTRPDTFEQVFELRTLVDQTVGTVPSVLALNKADLASEWRIADAQVSENEDSTWHVLRTSAKTGHGVEEAFLWIATAMTEDAET
ncbi:MAG: GTP-binding protein [Gemmatimonadota bacterium]|nr:GTP-binding protein [Gemmatimonadota bacterium]